MREDESVTQWLQAYQTGQEEALQPLWERYFQRLVVLAQAKLRSSSRRDIDGEDIALSVFDHFSRGVQAGRFPRLDDRQDLWQVLLMLANRRVATHQQYGLRQKRGAGQVQGESLFDLGDARPGLDALASAEPTPAFAAEMSETCRHLLLALPDDTFRQIAQKKLQGYTNAEIAAQLQMQTRTVERKLRTIRDLWAVSDAAMSGNPPQRGVVIEAPGEGEN